MKVLNPHGTPHLNHYLKCDARYPYMPVEFSGAAFRFGHSMVRPSYALNKAIGTDTGNADSNRIPTFNREASNPSRTSTGSLVRFRRIGESTGASFSICRRPT